MNEDDIKRIVLRARSIVRAVDLAQRRRGIVQVASQQIDNVESLRYMLQLHDEKQTQ